MQRELITQMFTVCADVINIMDPQIRLMQTNQVDSKSATAAQIARLRESEKQYNAHLHELVEIADQRGAMESIWHGCMELNQTYMNDYTTLMVRITKLKQMQSGAGQVPGVQDSGDLRSTGWGDMSDMAADQLTAELAGLITDKDRLKAEMQSTTTDISDQAEVMKTFDKTTLAVTAKYVASGTVNDKEKNISDLDVTKFTGELTVEMMTDAKSPLAAQLLVQTIMSILGAYPQQLAPIVPALMRVFAEARAGKLKSIPPSILGEQRKPGLMAAVGMSKSFQSAYIKASGALFSVFMRKFDMPLQNTLRPHKINGTDEAHQTIQSVRGDIVTSIFIIMDSMEKFGWDERNQKREFFAHGAILLGSEPSIKRGLALLKSPIVESLRIGVELDYDVLKQICVTVQRRDMAVFGETCRKYLNLDRDPNSPGYESNCLALLDELIAELSQKLVEYNVDECATVITSANHAESMIKMQGYANAVLGPGWEKTGKTDEKRSRGGRTEEYVDPKTYEPPAGYESIPCGSNTCSNNLTPKSFPFMNAVKFLSGKGLPASSQAKSLCRGCFDALKSGEKQSIETGVGTMVKVQDGNRVKIQLQKPNRSGSGSASAVHAKQNAGETETAATNNGVQSFGQEGQTEDEMKAQFSNMTVAQFNAMRNCFESMSDNSPM
jgi:hypothetical protein